MRLTLRTLLAYLDDILDPEDAKQLQNKIEDSEFATSLVHQIRGSVRRLRLDAPALDAQGIGGDLNSVAEYLDNVLPPEQVPSLEKACLDNEVNLSEVASCHQILTLVLGEPADVSEQMRQRSYGIAATVEPGELPPKLTVQEVRIDSADAHAAVPTPVTPAPKLPNVATTIQPGHSEPATDAPYGVAAQPKTSPKRPSKTFTVPAEVPSTREAWRAEAKEALEAVPDVGAAAPIAAAAILPGKPIASPPVASSGSPPSEHPEYLDRKSSWLRSAFITGLIALLILAGLLLATQPMDNSFFSRWLDGEPNLVADSEATPGLPTSPADSGEQVVQTPNVEIIDAGQSTRWTDPGTAFQPAIDQSPAADSPVLDSEVEIISVEPAQSNLLLPDDAPIPELIPNSRFSEEGLPGDLSHDDPNQGQTADLPNDAVNPEAPIQPDVLPPVEPPETTLAAKDPSAEVRRTEFNQRPFDGSDLPITDDVVAPELPAKDKIPEVPPAPESPIANIARAESPSVPLPLTNAVPLVDPTIDDLETAAIEPPVASPAANVISGAGAASRIPIETAPPEPTLSPTLEPTRLKDEDQLLLVFDTRIDDWTRVDSTIPLNSGDLLMGLTAFRADVEIGSSIVCTLINATHLQLGPAADVSLHRGQLLMRNENEGDKQGVRFQGRPFEIEMLGADGLVALESSQHHVPGSNVDELPHSLFRIYAMKNDIRVNFMGQQYDVSAGSYLTALDQYEPRVEVFSEKPLWTKSTWRTSADSNAVRLLKRNLNQSDNIRTWLQERATTRRYNERALAVRCLAEMDEFDAIIGALNSGEQHAFWDQHYATLRRALTRGSDTTEKLQIAMEKAHGGKAFFMMEMLRGFSEAQIRGGAAAKLVKYLSHKSLAHRVLALQNLKEITGWTLAFQPEKPFQQQTIKRWKGRLSSGRVTYQQAPEIIALLESFAVEDDTSK